MRDAVLLMPFIGMLLSKANLRDFEILCTLVYAPDDENSLHEA